MWQLLYFGILHVSMGLSEINQGSNLEKAVQYIDGPDVIPACVAPMVSRSIIITDNYTFSAGETIEISCIDGYRFPNFKPALIQLECQADGSWLDIVTHQKPTDCERIGSCPVPRIPHGAVLSKPGGYMPGDITPVMCDNAATYLIKCHTNGNWLTDTGNSDIQKCSALAKNCSTPPFLNHGGYHLFTTESNISSGSIPEGTKAMFFCLEGYTFEVPQVVLLTCSNGKWEGNAPECIPERNRSTCQAPEPIANAHYSIYRIGNNFGIKEGEFSKSTIIEFFCDDGYTLYGSSQRVCLGDKWTEGIPTCVPGCSSPPVVENANYNFFGKHTASSEENSKRIAEGSSVYYFCNSGFRKKESSAMSSLNCIKGEWKGEPPTCEPRMNCDAPMDIAHGNWVFLSTYYADYRIGSRVQYECAQGYKAIGASEIECDKSGYWSDFAPKCLPSDQYCSEPEPIENGFYMCNPNHCSQFIVGTQVQFLCSKGYTMQSDAWSQQVCQEGGQWSRADPVCVPDSDLSATTSSLELSSSTMSIVIVTSCTVLGMLVIVVLIYLILRKRNTCSQNSNYVQNSSNTMPNPYEPIYEPRLITTDDQDRVALIAYADGVPVILPSYEEATSEHGGTVSANRDRLHQVNHDSLRSSVRSGRGDYRPIHNFPYGPRHTAYLRELPFDQRDYHRNSIITNASMPIRVGDNLSLAFGSMDTMNISDNTSTTVTLGTYDSGASNPSLALSQRAVTGSLASSNSNPSMATEDAPLIESSEQVVHRSQTASPSIPEENEAEGHEVISMETHSKQ